MKAQADEMMDAMSAYAEAERLWREANREVEAARSRALEAGTVLAAADQRLRAALKRKGIL